MITAEDIKHMNQGDLEKFVTEGQAELDRRREANVEKAWTKFFEAAETLLNLKEKIEVDWDDPECDDGVIIWNLRQFCHYRDRE